MISAKDLLLQSAKRCGAFRLTERLTKGRLPILSYHGFSRSDTHLFRPSLYMRPDVFRRRLRWLFDARYNVVSLSLGLDMLSRNDVPPRTVVITIDDGTMSVDSIAVPALREFGFCATIYLTTYYVTHRNPVFRLLMQYMFWKTRLASINLSGFGNGFDGQHEILWGKGDVLMWRIIKEGEENRDESGRFDLARKMGECLEVPIAPICESEEFTLLSPEAVSRLAKEGFDFQLHTHRHRLPLSESECAREVADNRMIIEQLTHRRPEHLCYPSGEWSDAHAAILSRLGVKSATTCDPGLNVNSTSMYALRRILDHDHMSLITFEAQLRGFHDVLHRRS